MIKIKEENGQFVVYLNEEKTASFPTKAEAQAFADEQTKYPESEEKWVDNSKGSISNDA
ncbi:hypothetical protein [Enterococcus gallinarum]|uniref:hypothetical protein n=1 Tax=Enterococcus gallinarum TaxID=1353 RepID=UPI001431BA78|nr:hypothetical protein [Enterococcus gallinarum]MBF0825581.1 hypothetical protein [Enterococcus faecalis]MBX8991781.1 hypothetical protein [Escherichia coli]MBF0726240.1 hypothetical protein [Enterococcus gallinarum]MBF0799117.1 hypothetical protein [Enterococcus gallinarum]NYS82341.1 hypothetical protein [Enterococcus gallinarum]